ncbi:hypothetical protein BUALT_Bualt05G0001700 [Buddleja alternifolia]|uniref:Uncharacterized protein n=1 Tax=Buddleja alternifolia TaxID=168488 RepID=A0AAV6XM74_9LAMI|nr:hypothetical protein BUALT_Bualt05G0001700 [Buddleja alternifolia]
MIDIVKVEEQAAQLERDLILKERKTLDVLKELETTKNIIEELKLKLQKEAMEINAALNNNNVDFVAEIPEKGNHETVHQNGNAGLDLCPFEAPGFILLELKQAKLNLARTTTDLADIRATVDSYNKKIEKERVSLERTRQRLSSNTSKILSLEDELNKTRQKLEVMKDTEEVVKDGSDDPLNIMRELQKLKNEGSNKASEALGWTEIKALSNSETKCEDVITLTFEEYSSLISKAREAEQSCKNRVVDAMVRVDEANVSKTEILKKGEAAIEEVKISKKALEEVLSRVEEANRDKVSIYISRLPTMCPRLGHRVSRTIRRSATGCPVGQATVYQELPDARQPGAPRPCHRVHRTTRHPATGCPLDHATVSPDPPDTPWPGHHVPRPTRRSSARPPCA